MLVFPKRGKEKKSKHHVDSMGVGTSNPLMTHSAQLHVHLVDSCPNQSPSHQTSNGTQSTTRPPPSAISNTRNSYKYERIVPRMLHETNNPTDPCGLRGISDACDAFAGPHQLRKMWQVGDGLHNCQFRAIAHTQRINVLMTRDPLITSLESCFTREFC